MQLEKGRISGRQMMALIILGRIVSITITFPLITGLSPVQDAWLAGLVSLAVAIPFLVWIIKLAEWFPDKTIIEYAIEALGPFFGRIIGAAVLIYLIWDIVVATRSLGDSLTVAIMPETPILVFIIVLLAIAANAARCGLEVFSRMGENSLFVVLAFVLLIWVLPYEKTDFLRLKPVLSQGPLWLIRPSISSFSFYTELIVLGLIVPYLNKRDEALKYSLLGLLISGVILVVFAILVVAVFGPTANGLTMPPYSLTRMITIARFFERVEAISMGVWLLSSGINLATLLWAAAIGLAQIFNLKGYRFLVYPIAALAVPLSVVAFESIVELERFLEYDMWGYLSIIMVLVILLPLTAAWLFRRLRSDA